nr:MAG TPA: hypothetical protein [Caudoviricetes sp.]
MPILHKLFFSFVFTSFPFFCLYYSIPRHEMC